MKHKGLVILGVVVLVIVVVVFLILPLLFNANRYKPEIESRLSKALGRQVTVGDLSLSLLSGGIQAAHITIADDPAFSREPFLTAKSLTVGVELMPLLFHQQVVLQSLVLDGPTVRLLQSAGGKWNVSTIGARQSSSSDNSSGTDISVGKLQIDNGTINVGEASGKTEAYNNLNLKATDVSYTSAFPFSVSLDAPQGGKLKLDGKAGPLARSDMSRTPLTADIDIENFDLGATGFVPADSGLAGTLSYKGKVVSDGTTVQAEGQAQASKLKLVKGGSSAAQPVQIDYHSNYNLAHESGNIENTTIHVGKSTANLSGTYAEHAAATDLNLHFIANQMATGDVEGLLPALGVVLPAGSSLQGGTASANLNITGPADKLITAGTMNINNAKLAGFSMGQGLSSIASLAGIHAGSDTTIQVLGSNVHIAPDGMRFDNLNLVVPDIGSMTGSGTIGADSSLNFRLVAKLSGGGGGGAAASPVGLLSSALGSRVGGVAGGLKSIPIRITGTTSKPVFMPDVGAAIASQFTGATGKGQNSNPVGGILGGLLGGRKK